MRQARTEPKIFGAAQAALGITVPTKMLAEQWSDVSGGAGNADGLGSRRDGQNNPKDDVDQEAGAGKKDRQEPENADESGIEIKIIGKAGANAGDLFVPAGAHETLGSNHTWGRSGRTGQIGAAAVAEFRAVSDFFLAIWAKHERPPREKYARRF